MNFIIALAGSDSVPVSERIEAKRAIFCISDELEIHKLVYGLFLDGFTPEESEKTAYNNLSKYEFFAGSLTWNRTRIELETYLNSDLSQNLHKETRAQLQEFIELLKESHELNQLVDLYRSSRLELIFFAATGLGMSFVDNQMNLEAEQLQKLTSLALAKVRSLEVGQKAIFLMGTIIHETLLNVERLDENRFKLRYYDSAAGNNFRIIGAETLLDEKFWNHLYSLKFSANSAETAEKVKEHFGPLEKIEESDRDSHTALTNKQKKNTCHFRCLLAFWKDQILSNPKLTLEEAYLGWNLSKVGFGESVLKSEHLQNEQLATLSQKQQAKRARKQERASSFSRCILEGRAQETLQTYLDLINAIKYDPDNQKNLQNYSSANPLKDLVRAEEWLLKILISNLVTPDKFVHFFEHIKNPWVLESLELYNERWMERRKDFHEALGQELMKLESLDAEAFKYSSLQTLQKMDWGLYHCARGLGINYNTVNWVSSAELVFGAFLYENEVQGLLDLFEENIQRLQFLDQKPCFMNVLAQAVQLGKISQVDRIYRQLPEEDQNRFFLFCGKDECAFFPQMLPETIRDYLLKCESSNFTCALSTHYCKKAWQNGEFSDFFNIAGKSKPHRSLNIIVEASVVNMSSKEILKILAAAESYPDQMSIPNFYSIFSAIERLLLKCDNTDLINQACEFHIPSLAPFLDRCSITRYYKSGELEKIQTLELHKKELGYDLSDIHFSFSLENYELGLQLLSETTSTHFARILRNDLWKFAFQLNSGEIVLSVLASFEKNPCCKDLKDTSYNLEFNVQLFIMKTLNNQKGNELFIPFAKSVLNSAHAQDFEVLCTFFEALDPGVMASIVKEFDPGKLYEAISISKYSLFVKLVGKNLCLRNLINMYDSRGMQSRVKVYEEQYRPRFLTGWHFIALDFDPTNQKPFYQNEIKPLLEGYSFGEEGLEIVQDLLKDIPNADDFRPLIALVWLENGERERALKIYPDEFKLEEARENLL